MIHSRMKGIDANADEPPEFSDDEEERVYYEQLKAKQANSAKEADVPPKRKRATSKFLAEFQSFICYYTIFIFLGPSAGWQSNHPWNRSAQRQRRGNHRRGDQRQFSSMQNVNPPQNLWVQNQYNGAPIPRGFHLETEQYRYGMYPAAMQLMPYLNPNVNSQNFYGPDGYYNGNGTAMPLNPRVPFNASLRAPPGNLSLQNRSNSNPNVGYRSPSVFGQPQMPQTPPGMSLPWVPLPPPPPPPPSSDPS